ncbi:MAG: hypothetical protein ACI3Y1_00585, partial [Candidatus Cryptobacteroides sp.]
EPQYGTPHQRTAPARDFAQQSWKGLEGRRGLGWNPSKNSFGAGAPVWIASGGRGAENAEKWKNLEEIVTKWKKFAIFGLAYKID